MLPNYAGRPETFEDWRFQMIQFLSDDPPFAKLLEWAETDLGTDETTHAAAVEELDRTSAERIEAFKGQMLNPPSEEDLRALQALSRNNPRVEWYNQQLYQCLALNVKGESLALIKALAAPEYEKHLSLIHI